jgi:multidrug efflux pump subunit AcrA (membrane-fusion protein)
VFTPRPDERVGQRVEAGDIVLTLGRTDSLELDFAVDERDVIRVREGDEVHFRIGALPQRTFLGRVTWISPVAVDSAPAGSFPVRAMVANTDGLLKPGMAAYARVLTEPASGAWRILRDPARALRLWSWRIWR